MTKEEFKTIIDILIKTFDFDSLDLTEFILLFERKTHENIPDDWLNK